MNFLAFEDFGAEGLGFRVRLVVLNSGYLGSAEGWLESVKSVPWELL